MAYDNEEGLHVYTRKGDLNGGRERIGMGILISKYLQSVKNEVLERSLLEYTEYVTRELVDVKTGKVSNDIGHDVSWKRLYNAPWFATFFIELYQQHKNKKFLTVACRILRCFYDAGGVDFYPIDLPILLLDNALKDASMLEEEQGMRQLFIKHADRIAERGIQYPSSEVNYEQSIVAPAAAVLLEAYVITGEEKYLQAGRKQVQILELFNGMQPDYHLYEVAIRHWDGYWFGKRKLYGDTFPHYWSALTGNVFGLFAQITNGFQGRKRNAR